MVTFLIRKTHNMPSRPNDDKQKRLIHYISNRYNVDLSETDYKEITFLPFLVVLLDMSNEI